ncbi:hypothetical protein PO124_33165 [Bacillus licheniformis]|nr:hypothetical protein [Bacillus licheniformis]
MASSVVLVTLQPIFSFIGTYFYLKKESRSLGSSVRFSRSAEACTSAGGFQSKRPGALRRYPGALACALVTAYLLFGQHVRNATA